MRQATSRPRRVAPVNGGCYGFRRGCTYPRMQRHSFETGGLQLSYLDASGTAPVLIALHAHWMEAQTFAPLAQALAPDWRVVALDQRGHGDSEHTQEHGRAHYEQDVLA
jgi:esterase